MYHCILAMHESFYANTTTAWIILLNAYTNLYIGETTARKPNNLARESKQYSIGEYASAIRMQMAEHAAPIWWKCPIRGPPFADKIKGFISHDEYNHCRFARFFLEYAILEILGIPQDKVYY